MTTEVNNKKWYIVQVVTGYENKVKEELENKNFEDNEQLEVLLPKKVHTTKTGKLNSKPMFPGYLYVRVEMTDDSWFIIRNTSYVTGIVGSSGQRTKPTPVRDAEIQKIIERHNEEILKLENLSLNKDKHVITNTNYVEGDTVKITKGEFAGQEGKVTNISIERQKTTVEIYFFERLTSIEIDLDLVQKV